jgi:2-polyprenyl-3-methyl-5-hydroxy-6-metoxy-1,4-benzoquinol methylase
MSNYNTWHRTHLDDDDTATPWHDFVKSELDQSDFNGKTVLEIGCGRGGFARYIISQYNNIKTFYACDYSESAIEIAKSSLNSPQQIILQIEDIQNLSFADASFDTIISCETIEHVPMPNKALSEIYRVLKPGGRFFLTCPNYFNLFGLWCLYRKLIGKPYTEGGQPYVNYIWAPSIYVRLTTLGFTVKHFHSTELVLPARFPKTFFYTGTPSWLTFFGSRTFYVLNKRK